MLSTPIFRVPILGRKGRLVNCHLSLAPMKRAALVGMAILLVACTRTPQVQQFRGKTMGTTYQVTYIGTGLAFTAEVESLLTEINQSMSTYMPTSLISRINASTDTNQWHSVDRHFKVVFQRSREIYKDTGGAFNPAVGPLVDAWGFGAGNPESLPDDNRVRALLGVVDFDAFDIQEAPFAVRKHSAEARLDFSAIAEGYGVDAVGELLERGGVENYLVEIGGEVRARGEREKGRPWRVGVERPAENALADRQVLKVFELRDRGLATSGTYRNYQIQNGRKIAHIIDPKTGYPAQNSLLSVTVIAGDAMTADAYATALMVMGLEEGIAFVEARKGLQAYFLVEGESGKIDEKRTSGFPSAVEE